MKIETQFKACVSYAWDDELRSHPGGFGRVSEFCKSMEQRGIEIVRDKTHLRNSERLSDFESRIGAADHIFVFLSDAYLRSPSCMNELYLVWQNCGADRDEFLRRVIVFPMPGCKIYSDADQLNCAKYWKDQYDQLEKLANEIGIGNLSEERLRRLKLIESFAEQVDEMLMELTDVLLVGDFDRFTQVAAERFGKARSGAILKSC